MSDLIQELGNIAGNLIQLVNQTKVKNERLKLMETHAKIGILMAYAHNFIVDDNDEQYRQLVEEAMEISEMIGNYTGNFLELTWLLNTLEEIFRTVESLFAAFPTAYSANSGEELSLQGITGENCVIN